MMTRLIHIMVLLAFVVSTISGFAIAMPIDHQMMHQKTVEKATSHHALKHAADAMKADYSCGKAKQTAKTQNQDDSKKCCDNDCQCVMNNCVKIQPLYHLAGMTFVPIYTKLIFISDNEHYDDSIIYLLKRPPKV